MSLKEKIKPSAPKVRFINSRQAAIASSTGTMPKDDNLEIQRLKNTLLNQIFDKIKRKAEVGARFTSVVLNPEESNFVEEVIYEVSSRGFSVHNATELTGSNSVGEIVLLIYWYNTELF